jgi:hypothetical protein
MRFMLRLGIVALVFVATVSAQQAKPLDTKLPDIIDRMENGDLETREAAFDELMTTMASDEPTHPQSTISANLPNRFIARHPEHADRVKLGLIHLLTNEKLSIR